MSMQARLDNTTVPFIRFGETFIDEDGIIKQDAGRAVALARFTVMGKSGATIPATMTADGGNTGNGTVTLVDFAPNGPIKAGTWELECTFVVADGGVFKLTDPDGVIVANNLTLRVGAGLLTAFIEGGIAFTVTEGGTDFAAADKFTVLVTADGDYVPLDVAGVNGSQKVAGIYLLESITAAKIVAGDVPNSAMLVGSMCTFDSGQLIFDDGVTTLDTILPSGETVRSELAKFGMFAETTIDIDEYET